MMVFALDPDRGFRRSRFIADKCAKNVMRQHAGPRFHSLFYDWLKVLQRLNVARLNQSELPFLFGPVVWQIARQRRDCEVRWNVALHDGLDDFR
jgi:hypothetical protein